MTWINVGSGTHNAPEPWVNIDTRVTDNTHPDVIVPSGSPLPFDIASCGRVLLSHVLEHVAWPDVPGFLTEIRRVLDGDLLVVGPDTHRTIRRWRDGQEPWWLVESVMEHAAHPERDGGWPEASHRWNCHEARVVEALELAGFVDIEAVDVMKVDGWPLVQPAPWQFALLAR